MLSPKADGQHKSEQLQGWKGLLDYEGRQFEVKGSVQESLNIAVKSLLMKIRVFHATGDIFTHPLVLNLKAWSYVCILLNSQRSQDMPVSILAKELS